MTDLNLACQCGQVKGTITEVAAGRNNHLICYCSDCRAFADHLEAGQVTLDESGGSRIVQVRPSQIRITQGAEHLRSLRLTRKGVLRWYAGCCKTPLANTVSAAIPFTGVIVPFVPAEEIQSALGDPSFEVQAQHATGPVASSAAKAFPLRLTVKMIFQILMAKLGGHHRPSPFFGEDGRPVSKPEILS